MAKRIGYISVLVLAVLLSGCFSALKPSITMDITPDPVVFTFEQLEKDITVTFKMKGISLSKNLDKITITVLDDQDDLFWTTTQNIGTSVPIVPGITHPETVTINLAEDIDPDYATEAFYDAQLKGKTYTLSLVLISDLEDDVTAEVDIKFE